ncbi:MAG: AsmA family protein [Flavobacterium sp.]|nr:MAG: AsmA family protein [Flavobacterium sp.]
MGENSRVKQFWNTIRTPRWAKFLLRGVLVVLLLMVTAYVSLAWYINSHKEEVLASVTEKLNEGLQGSITIGDMEPTFLKGFPLVSLRLEDVIIRDSLYAEHNHTLLNAGSLELSVNALALMRGTIEIKKVSIIDAAIDLFTDVDGYSTTAVFKKSEGEPGSGGGTFPELRKFSLENVSFVIDNRKGGKLYNFKIADLSGAMKYSSKGWDADINLNTLVKSMAFSTRKGSFIKDKIVDGDFDINFNESEGLITVAPNDLEIGGEDFIVGAKFKTTGPTSDFSINIENKKILWKNASHLLSPNITSRLDMFDLTEPISVKCDIIGDFNIVGDPLIRVNAIIKDNLLTTPGGQVSKCNFTGVFTNNHVKEKGFNDANSAVKLFNFKGNYGDIPISMKKVFILDFEKPIAVGDFSSKFEVAKLASLIDEGLMKFSKGTADVKVNFKADIVNFMLAKPLVDGVIKINNANVAYVPRKLEFKDINVALNFTKDDLDISKINMKSGKSIVTMQGSIKNFLNLYYTAPEKIVLNWKIHSPQLHLGEFMGFLGSRNKGAKVKKKPGEGSFSEELNQLFDRSNVDIKLRVDKLYYNKFLATNVGADVFLTESGVIIKNAGLQHAGGTLVLSGNMEQKGAVNKYNMNATVNNVDIRKFFHAFSNFGLESLQANNLKGVLSTKANVSGNITDAGTMVPKSMNGTVSFAIKKGALIDFAPVRSVGKFAFPFRKMDTITFNNLNGKFDVKGEKVTIQPMQINSSILNMDIAGVYSFGKGTNINVDVPLRNPKKDKDITDEEELAKRRNRGIVLHLVALDDTDGKVKVKLGSGKKD